MRRSHFYEDYDRYRNLGTKRIAWNPSNLHFTRGDYSDEGLATRSHRRSREGFDRPGMRSSNPGFRDYSYGPQDYGYDETFDHDFSRTLNAEQAPVFKTGHYGRGPKGYQRSDDRIKEDASEILFRHNEVDARGIEVSVKDGVVTLAGTVETRSMKREAEMAIENISGVEDVQNTLRITPTSPGAETPKASH